MERSKNWKKSAILCLDIYPSFEVPFLPTDCSISFQPIDWFICTIHDCRVLVDVNLIHIVDETVGLTVVSHFMAFIPVESSYI